MTITVWFHDPAEVEPALSWTGLVPQLAEASYRDIQACETVAVTELFGYARPDAVIESNGEPVLSIEQTMMNPSGHNLPQRFSCLLKAAERRVAGVIYHPEYSRRTYSDPNPRYANPRVALAQLRMLDLFSAAPPSLSVYWPTDGSLLPDRSQGAQANLARVVTGVMNHRGSPAAMRRMPEFSEATEEMQRVIDSYGPRIPRNRSFAELFPEGVEHARTSDGHPVDPPRKATFAHTDDWIANLVKRTSLSRDAIDEVRRFLPHSLTLTFPATANRARNDSEHPWPGYFSLLDVLYAREGPNRSERKLNMVYSLPITIETWLKRLPNEPAMMRIVDAIADVIILHGGVVAGGGIAAGAPEVLGRGKGLIS